MKDGFLCNYLYLVDNLWPASIVKDGHNLYDRSRISVSGSSCTLVGNLSTQNVDHRYNLSEL